MQPNEPVKNYEDDLAQQISTRPSGGAAGQAKNNDLNQKAAGNEANSSSKVGSKSGPLQEVDAHAEGVRLGHYVFGKSLGKGTFGKVKMAQHILTKENVAIKILEKARIKDRKDIARISREIKILKKVRHPNVIQLYEIIETETELYLIMEYCVNGELFDYIVQQQRLHEKAAVRIYQQLIAGIEYIHKSGICHRDLKPENLLLDFDKTLKIVDFGLSNVYEPPDGLLKTACGSPCYAAPEMIAGKKYKGVKSDIWSSGVVLYAMVCGFLPFEDPKTSNLYKKIMAGEFKIPRFLSTDCSHFLSKILQTNPDDRYGIEQIREHPWYRQFRDKQPIGLFPGSELMPVEDNIYEQILDEFGFDPDYSVKCIEANRHNNITATYHLLYKRILREQKPFTNASHVTGSLDRAAIARYEQMEANNNNGSQISNNRAPRFNPNVNDQQNLPGQPQQKRGISTNYNQYKNQYALQSVNGGPETADLNPDQNTTISAQKRYKMELQAEISKLRGKYQKATQNQPKVARNANETPSQVIGEVAVMRPSQKSMITTETQPVEPRISLVKQMNKRTERQPPRVNEAIANASEIGSPETQRKRPLQNRVNIVQIQNQQLEPSREELKEDSINPKTAMLPKKLQNKQQNKQYSSQPESQQAQHNRLTEDDEMFFGGSELQERRVDDPEKNSQQNQFFDTSAHKVSTISSLGGGTKSGSEQQRNKFPSATTTKGSQLLRRHMQNKRSSAKKHQDQTRELLNVSMPINLPAQQFGNDPVNRASIRSGGRKASQNVPQMSTQNPQLRYRHQKTSTVNGGSALNVSQFNTIGDTQDLAMQIRSKKEKQYVSLNGTQSLVGDSIDLTQSTTGAQPATYSTIAAGQSSKNGVQISMNQRQIEHLTNNLNRSQQKRSSIKADSQAKEKAAAKYNLNRASIGGIIGQQKHEQAQRVKQQMKQQSQSKGVSKAGIMPNINENPDNMPALHQRPPGQTAQHIAMKHRQSFKQTVNLNKQLMIANDGSSPVNDPSSILARRAGSLQWRNASNPSNREGGRDSVASNHSGTIKPKQILVSTMLQGIKPPSQGSHSQARNSQSNVAQNAEFGSLGDYDFAPMDPLSHTGVLPFKKHSHHPARVITSSESGQVGQSKPLQLTQINPQSLGQTSEIQMNAFAPNPIDFHKVNLMPANSMKAQVMSNQVNNKAQQLKNRKGINQSIDYKPQQIQQIKQGLKTSTQVMPASQATRKSAQSRQFALDSELSQNNYTTSSVSGWVNQSILPAQQKSELLDQSTNSIINRARIANQTVLASKNEGSGAGQSETHISNNYNINQLYQQYAGQSSKGTRLIKGRGGTGNLVARQGANTVLEQHSGVLLEQLLNQSLKAVDNNAAAQSQLTTKKQTVIDNRMKEVLATLTQDRQEMRGGGVNDDFMPGNTTKITTNRQRVGNSLNNTQNASGIAQKAPHTKAKQSVRKSRIEIPATIVVKEGLNLRTTPVQHPKRKATESGQGGSASRSVESRFQPNK